MRFTYRSQRSFFFFSSRRRHTRSLCDWSSDVCSSDLIQFSRRDVLCASTAIVANSLAQPVRAQTRAAAAEPITPALVEAAKKEGKLAFYKIGRASCRERV